MCVPYVTEDELASSGKAGYEDPPMMDSPVGDVDFILVTVSPDYSVMETVNHEVIH